MNEQLIKYIENKIFPQYNKYYSHGINHINYVIEKIMIAAEYYQLDKNICYTIAAYHDIGLNINRKQHEYESGKVLENDIGLKKYFSKEEIILMKEAVEDHRGSKKDRPRSFYGEVLSDCDRDLDVKILASRQLFTSIKNYRNLTNFEEHFERSYNYILNRNNKSKGINLWTNNPELVKQRNEFEQIYLNKELTKEYYKKEYNNLIENITLDKILNHYEDY